MMAAGTNTYIFSALEKFADGNGAELNSFLTKFDRCCLIGNKADADGQPIKGQLLMLFVEGRARATLEEFEATHGGRQQTYVDLAAKLREHFDNAETRETSMSLFEARIQKVNESEEEFMLQLLKLYSTANPDHAEAVKLLAVKRKFMAGIPTELKRNIFVFCADPFDNGVTREHLLTHCRKARNLMLTQNAVQNDSGYASDRVLVHSSDNGARHGAPASGGDSVLAAINKLSLQVQDHVNNTERRFEDVGEALAAVGYGQRNNFRGRGGYRNSGNRGAFGNSGNRFQFNNNGRGGFNGNSSRGNSGRRGGRGGNNNNGRGNNVQKICHNCDEPNHIARFCTAPKSGNC